MESRRQFLFVAATTLGLAPTLAWLGRPGRPAALADRSFRVQKSDDQWRSELSPEQFHVMREHGTERAFTSPLNNEKRPGTFKCGACGTPLFTSDTKYDSGTGWPSFYKPIEGAIGTSVDRSMFMVRTEVHCANCGGHLGHLFPDGPQPTGERYCMNGVALEFEPKST